MAGDESKDFFISYNKADRGWEEWIAFALENEFGHKDKKEPTTLEKLYEELDKSSFLICVR